ncbi:hypothetical protein F4X10_08055 [Candidatus Poribacteria bacterium]|nr:hypothetical protein [Candidatus Poribacteria bacterium]
MAAKKVNLAEVFQKNEESQNPELRVVESDPPVGARSPRPPSREKKKHIGGYFDEAVYRQMKHIGIEKGMTTQDILKEALNAFFRLHDKPPIA